MKYTWQELDSLLDKILVIRDRYIEITPMSVFVILYEDLKILQQEIRIFNEVNNLLKLHYGEGTLDYEERYKELLQVEVEVELKKFDLSFFGETEITPIALTYLMPFLMEEYNNDSD